MATEISRKLFTVHDYHRMVDAGILSEDDRVELIRGEILAMSPIGPRHSAAVLRATQALVRIVGDRAIVGVQGSVRLDEYDEPQPDIYLLRPKDDFYASGHAGPLDIFLIVEVADSSLEYDRTIKLNLYAETGGPEYRICGITVASRTRIFTKIVTARLNNSRGATRSRRNFFPTVEYRSMFSCPDQVSASGSRTIVPGLGTIVPELGFANSFQQCNSLKSLTDFQF